MLKTEKSGKTQKEKRSVIMEKKLNKSGVRPDNKTNKKSYQPPDREVYKLWTPTLPEGPWSHWTTPVTKSVCKVVETSLNYVLLTPVGPHYQETKWLAPRADGPRPSSTTNGRSICLWMKGNAPLTFQNTQASAQPLSKKTATRHY